MRLAYPIRILGCVGRRHGKIGLHNTGLGVLRLGKDAELKLWGGYILKAASVAEYDFVSVDGLRQALVPAKLSPRKVQARAKLAASKSPANLSITDECRRQIALCSHIESLLLRPAKRLSLR